MGRRHTSGGGTCPTIPCPSYSVSRSWLGEGYGPSLGFVRFGTSCQRVPRHGGRSSSYSVAYSLGVGSPFGDASPSSDAPGKGEDASYAPPECLSPRLPQWAADRQWHKGALTTPRCRAVAGLHSSRMLTMRRMQWYLCGRRAIMPDNDGDDP